MTRWDGRRCPGIFFPDKWFLVDSQDKERWGVVTTNGQLLYFLSGTHYFMGSETRRRRGVEGD